MPQFDVYRNPNPETEQAFPYLVDVQADLLRGLETRTVIPLSRAIELTSYPVAYLTPVVTFEGEAYALITPQLAGIARSDLGAHAGSMANQERAVLAAIDFLIRGF